MTVGI